MYIYFSVELELLLHILLSRYLCRVVGFLVGAELGTLILTSCVELSGSRSARSSER